MKASSRERGLVRAWTWTWTTRQRSNWSIRTAMATYLCFSDYIISNILKLYKTTICTTPDPEMLNPELGKELALQDGVHLLLDSNG